jgi:hypothetical protein
MKRPVGHGDLVLFPDFDGVLHHEMCCGARMDAYLSAPEGCSSMPHCWRRFWSLIPTENRVEHLLGASPWMLKDSETTKGS